MKRPGRREAMFGVGPRASPAFAKPTVAPARSATTMRPGRDVSDSYPVLVTRKG